jgi:Tfp pilus assembly protein PilF
MLLSNRRFLLGGALALAAAIAVLLLPPTHPVSPPPAPAPVSQSQPATYVGTAACKGCHESQYHAWLGSHHQRAMQEASEATVLGDFRDAKVAHFDITSHLFRRDGRFFINTDGADGKLHDFEIRYTFGVYPLQQYLVAFPDGRLQALPIAWDSRPRSEGGQRWMHLYPREKLHGGDELHWTNLQQNWNYMCAECHSTDLKKNYDAAANTFHTSWKDISVGCEACHGAGSAHLQWAASRPPGQGYAAGQDDGLLAHFNDRQGASWVLDPATGNSRRSRARANTDEVEACGRCHSRAGKISEDWKPGKPLADTHQVALLEEGLYTADGQMQDEVYNYGSFLQSRMFAAGVTCSDCHDPHSQKLRADNPEVCGLCHSLSKYGSAAHHHHKEQSAESRCPACHMPVRTYMVVHQRHDHSFRVPRPDESVKFGTPNACNDCHKDRSPAWAAKATASWYGGVHPGYQHFTQALTDARRQGAQAAQELLALAADEASPGIARATALRELTAYIDSDTLSAAQAGLRSTDELVRLAAVELLAAAEAPTRWQALAPLLHDPVRAVRITAASELVDALPPDASPEVRRSLQGALDEFLATQRLNADRPEAHLALGDLYTRQGDAPAADREYREAIKLWPGFVPGYVNHADLSRALGHEDEAEGWLMQATRVAPDNAAVALSLGLLRVRQHRTPEALTLMARAVKLAPENAHYAYVYAVGLYSAGKVAPALELLRRTAGRFPGNREVLLGLASLTAESGHAAAARRYAQQYVAMAPADPSGAQLLQQLEQRAPAVR